MVSISAAERESPLFIGAFSKVTLVKAGAARYDPANNAFKVPYEVVTPR